MAALATSNWTSGENGAGERPREGDYQMNVGNYANLISAENREPTTDNNVFTLRSETEMFPSAAYNITGARFALVIKVRQRVQLLKPTGAHYEAFPTHHVTISSCKWTRAMALLGLAVCFTHTR